jgi:uncharacterized repeat protein (TIGR01451 family)
MGGGIIIPNGQECNLNGPNACEDGVDNDGDGLIDSADPECGSVGPGTSFAVIGSDPTARYSVNMGGLTHIRHARGDGSTVDQGLVSQFWISGVCNAGQCACPDTAGNPTLSHPSCQVEGRTCTTDADCGAGGYPGNFSNASVCGFNFSGKRGAVIEGKLVSRGSVNFGRGYLGDTNIVSVGDRFACDGCDTRHTGISTVPPWVKYQAEPPFIGAGVCFPSNAKSCYSYIDCLTAPAASGDECSGRLQFALTAHPLIDFTGGNDVAACAAAMGGMAASADPNNPGGLTDVALPGIPAFDPNNPGLNLVAFPPLTSNRIKVASGRTQTLVFQGPGLHVRNIDDVYLSSVANLNLQGQSDAVVVLRVMGPFRMGGRNQINLIPADPNDPNDVLRVSNVLWLLDGDDGKFSIASNSEFSGTVLGPERGLIAIGGANSVRGSLFAKRVDIKTNSELFHMPFTGSIGTDLSLTKDQVPDPNNPSTSVVPPGVVAAGEDIIYTIEVTNNGPSVATGVVVTDVLPESPGQPGVDGVSVNTAVSSQGVCQVVSIVGSADRVLCFIGTMNVTDSVTITIDVTTKPFARGILINSASVESSVDENLPTDNIAQAATAAVGVADLAITKSDLPDPAIAGVTNGLTYTINVNNLGPSDAFEANPPGVLVFDGVPSDLAVVSAIHTDGGGGGPNPCQVDVSNTVTCELGAIAVADANDVITIVVTPACGVHLTNPPSSPMTNTTNLSNAGAEADPNGANNNASTTTGFNGEVDLISSKVDSVPTHVIAGQNMFYTVTVDNQGPSTASDVTFVDELPAGVEFDTSAGCNATGGTAYVDQEVTCTYTSDVVCETAPTLQVNVKVNKNVANNTVLTNNITSVTSANETETNGANNNSSTTTLVRRQSDLAITKSFQPVAPETACVPGAQVEYTMVVTNAGSSDATGAAVTDNFDSNLTCSWTCTASGDASCITGQPNGTGDAGVGSINELVDIAAGIGPAHNVTYVATCTIASSMRGPLSNTASVAQEVGALADPNLSNNSANTSCNLVPRADLVVTKVLTSSPDHIAGVAGDITYLITVTNNGPSDASDGTGVTLEDDIPAGTSVHLISPSQGPACTGTTTRSCNLGDILAGNNATVQLQLTAACGTRGTIVNTARATTNGEADPLSPNTVTNNGATVVGEVNLSLNKTASFETPAFVTAGQIFTYTIDVANTGPSDAQSVVVTDTLDADVTVQLPLPAGCTHPGGAGGTITCNLPDLACNTGTAQRVFSVQATTSVAAVIPSDLGEIDNSASITTSDTLGTTSDSDTTETDLRLDQGVTCTSGVNSDCETNNCVTTNGDNVCCDTSCGSLCEACRQSKTGVSDGTCSFVSNDSDPDNECATTAPGTCGQDGFCGGMNDAGSGVDRRGQCGLTNIGVSCTGNGLGTGGCSFPDSCDGLGTCLNNDLPEFNPCTGNGVNECSNADSCNSNGTCNNRDVSAGTPCTDTALPSVGNCLDAQCNGTGACDQSFAIEPNGTGCADGDFCNGGDQCSSGTCSVHAGDPCDGTDGDGDCSEQCVDTGYEVGNCDGADPNGTACADGNFCNGTDTCSVGNCSIHTGDPCDGPDGDGDCSETCVPTGADVGNCDGNDVNGSACNDSNGATYADACNGGGTCVGTPHVPPTVNNTIFVSNEAGSGHTVDADCGTPTEPCSTINWGLQRAVDTGKEGVCIEISTYNETVTLRDGKNVRGGFNRDGNGNWVPNQGRSTVTGAASGSVVGTSVSNILIDRLAIISANASGDGVSSYGIRLVGTSNITVSNNTVLAGTGSAGNNGATGANGAVGGIGGAGGAQSCDSDIPFNGGTAGTSSCTRPGGPGGEGGYSNAAGITGTNGTVSGGGGGNGGTGGAAGQQGLAGSPGGGGTAGTDSTAHGIGGSGGSDVGGIWDSTNGGTGGNGTDGHGGGGGGGGGGQGSTLAAHGNGSGGGGGGGGGCRGFGGEGGHGGGGSFGIYISGGGTVTMTDNTVQSGTGGNGGTGASRGLGGNGGGGGAGGSNACPGEVGTGASGGAGGRGGHGGHGGGGAGGPTISIFCSGGTQVCSGNARSNGNAGTGGGSPVNAGSGGADVLSSGCGGGC